VTVVGISLVKDEGDIIEATVSNMLRQVDEVIVADNGSQDETREILDRLGVEVIEDPEVGYFQSRKMSALALRAAEQGADWVIPFDADEIWYSPFGRIADVLAAHQGAVAIAPIYDHVATGEDRPDGNAVERIGWRRREACPLHKVACRPLLPVTISQGNHGAIYPTQNPLDGQLVVRHYPNRSVEQLVRKVRNGAAAYAATDLPLDQGKHWREWGQLLEQGGEEAIGDLFREWYWSADPSADPHLIFDPAPCLSQS